LRVVSKKQGGHGAAVMDGYRRALDAGPAWVFQTDSDGEIAAGEFRLLWQQREQSPFILGCRRQRQETWTRRGITRGVSWLLWLGWGCHVRDANVPFRLMRARELAALLEDVPADSFAPNIFLSIVAAQHGLDVHSVSVQHRGRQGGSSSLVTWRLLRVCARCARELLAFRFTASSRASVRRQPAA
jgi:hypothetical protein